MIRAIRASSSKGHPKYTAAKPRKNRLPRSGVQKFGLMGSAQGCDESLGNPDCSHAARVSGPVTCWSCRRTRKKNSCVGSTCQIEGSSRFGMGSKMLCDYVFLSYGVRDQRAVRRRLTRFVERADEKQVVGSAAQTYLEGVHPIDRESGCDFEPVVVPTRCQRRRSTYGDREGEKKVHRLLLAPNQLLDCDCA